MQSNLEMPNELVFIILITHFFQWFPIFNSLIRSKYLAVITIIPWSHASLSLT